MKYFLWAEAELHRSLYIMLWISIALYTTTSILGQETAVIGDVQNEVFFVEKAIEKNPQYKAMQHDTAGMRRMYESETMFMENPMFSAGLVNVPLTSFPSLASDPMSGFSFMLSQTFALPGESESRKKMALMNFESRAYETENMRRMLINQTQNTYHELVFLYRKKKLLAENRNTLESIVSISRSLVSVNKMNSSQLLKLEAGMSQLDSEILEVSAMISKTESAMENLSTVKPEENLIEVGSLSPEEISIPVLPGDSSHPLIQNSQAVLEKARANKSHEESKYFPSVTLSAEYMLREPVDGSAMGGDDMISLRVTAPLPLFFVIKETRSVMAAEEGILQARQNLEQVKLALKTAWEGEYEMAMRNREVYARYRNEVLPRFLASYKAQLGSLASGAVSLLDVLDAYRDYLEVSIKEAGIYRDLQKSIAMLKYLEGKNEK